jgi:hypothetical protein
MPRTYTVYLEDKQLKITNEQLSEFAEYIGLKESYKNRVSELLILDLFVYTTEFGVSPHDVIEEIENLENGDGNTQTKPAAEFRRPPLQGLWHKHYFSAHFLVPNIQNALKGGKLEDLINEVMDPEKSDVITKEMISEFAHRVTTEPVEDRANLNKLTGEWIVFAKEGGKNYYLCHNTHKAGDQQIADRIKDHCTREFPFISAYFES